MSSNHLRCPVKKGPSLCWLHSLAKGVPAGLGSTGQPLGEGAGSDGARCGLLLVLKAFSGGLRAFWMPSGDPGEKRHLPPGRGLVGVGSQRTGLCGPATFIEFLVVTSQAFHKHDLICFPQPFEFGVVLIL